MTAAPEPFTAEEIAVANTLTYDRVSGLLRQDGTPATDRESAAFIWLKQLASPRIKAVSVDRDGLGRIEIEPTASVEHTGPCGYVEDGGCGHLASCALHNEPAMPNGPCNCGGLRSAKPVQEMTAGRARAIISLRIANALAAMPPRAAERAPAIDVNVPIAALRALLDRTEDAT